MGNFFENLEQPVESASPTWGMAVDNVHLTLLFHKKSCLNFGDNITLHAFNNKKCILFNRKNKNKNRNIPIEAIDIYGVFT